jgi:hypothetical protein
LAQTEVRCAAAYSSSQCKPETKFVC